jgi:hypothetical protein
MFKTNLNSGQSVSGIDEFGGTKGVIRSSKKDRQHNYQQKKDKRTKMINKIYT